jgi:hypothetical protein
LSLLQSLLRNAAAQIEVLLAVFKPKGILQVDHTVVDIFCDFDASALRL